MEQLLSPAFIFARTTTWIISSVRKWLLVIKMPLLSLATSTTSQSFNCALHAWGGCCWILCKMWYGALSITMQLLLLSLPPLSFPGSDAIPCCQSYAHRSAVPFGKMAFSFCKATGVHVTFWIKRGHSFQSDSLQAAHDQTKCLHLHHPTIECWLLPLGTFNSQSHVLLIQNTK